MISDERLQTLGLSKRTIALWGPLIRAFTLAVLLAVGAYPNLTLGRLVRSTYLDRNLSDFGVFYDSAKRAASGTADPYTVKPGFSPNLNPPQVFFLLVPLSKIDRATAYVIWTAGSVAAAVLTLHLIFGQLPVQRRATTFAWAAFAILCATPTGAVLHFAQFSWLLWPAVTSAWILARNDRWVQGAVVAGIVMSLKPFLGILLLAMTSQRQTKAALIAVGTAAVCFVMGAAAFGWGALQGWVSAVLSVTWAGNMFNASLFGLSQRLFNASAGPDALAPIVKAPLFATGLWSLATIAVVAISWRAIHSDVNRPSIDRVFAITISAALLISPLGWIYYHFFLVGPYAALWSDQRWRSQGLPRRLLFIGGFLCLFVPPGLLFFQQPSPWATASIGSVYFWGTFALWLSAIAAPSAADQEHT